MPSVCSRIAAAFPHAPSITAQLTRQHLPPCRLDYDESRPDRLVFRTESHRIIVTPCLAAGVVVTVKGRNGDNARARLRDAFQAALEAQLAPDVGEDLPPDIARLVGVEL